MQIELLEVFSSVARSTIRVIFSPTTSPITCHNKPAVAHTDCCFDSMNQSASSQDSFIKSCLFLQHFNFLFIAFIMQRIPCHQIGIPFFKTSFIRNHLNSMTCMNPKIIVTFRTDIVCIFYVLRKKLPICRHYIFFNSPSGTSGFLELFSVSEI